MEIPQRDLPLFPLNTVLFPRMPLPLHIFEPRYREMIARCVAEGIGFGVLLIKQGEEVGGPAEPYSVGTAARIIHAEPLEAGDLNLLTMGVVRFRLLGTNTSRAYLSGDIELWQDEMGDTKALPKLTRVAHKNYIAYTADLMELVARDSDNSQIVAPFDPQILSYTIAGNLQITNEEKQALLETATVEERLQQELVLLEREREFLARMKTLRDWLPQDDEGIFSKN